MKCCWVSVHSFLHPSIRNKNEEYPEILLFPKTPISDMFLRHFATCRSMVRSSVHSYYRNRRKYLAVSDKRVSLAKKRDLVYIVNWFTAFVHSSKVENLSSSEVEIHLWIIFPSGVLLTSFGLFCPVKIKFRMKPMA